MDTSVPENKLQCAKCINYIRNIKNTICKAFPEGIPEDILSDEFEHIKKHPKQKNDILFEQVK